jgi:diguanylate cyclase (GGDEF)-like protein/PAS domain S-box-containing protein
MPTWREFTGLSLEQIRGWGFLESVHPEDRNLLIKTWSAAARDLKSYETEYRIRRKDGEYRMFEVRGIPISIADGTIREWVGTCTDITERKRAEARLAFMAQHDALTGLPNRMQFFQQMEQAIAETAGTHQQLAVLFIDLDHFKSINDQMGHAVGDEVLMVVASRLRRAVRSDDIVARLGGDEFVVLIRGAGIAPIASSVTRKILGALNERVTLNGAVLQIGASVGISLYPEDGVTAEDLILRADSAMYKAKVNGRRTFASHQAGVLEIEKHQPGPSAEGTLGAAERANAGAEDDIER